MKLVYGCVIALSMYSRIPMPRVEWTKERMEHVLCFFPLVGIAEGMILGGWLLVSRWLGLSELMTALWGTAVPTCSSRRRRRTPRRSCPADPC